MRFRFGSVNQSDLGFNTGIFTYPINIDQEHRLLAEMFADLLVALHKPNSNKNTDHDIITEALKAIKQYNF